jgi:hypothetical protein
MKEQETKSIRIDKNIHKKLKIYCIENELKINNILEKIISEYLKINFKNDNN